jgi:hypothetical protein
VTVDYKIRIENGGLTISQHVDGAASPGNSQSQGVSGNLTILGNSFAGSKAAKTAASGGNPPGSLIGGNPPGSLIGGNPPGSLIGGGAPTSGDITVFGPVVIDAAGLIHRCPSGRTSEEKGKE